jgi:hypothetical protein
VLSSISEIQIPGKLLYSAMSVLGKANKAFQVKPSHSNAIVTRPSPIMWTFMPLTTSHFTRFTALSAQQVRMEPITSGTERRT